MTDALHINDAFADSLAKPLEAPLGVSSTGPTDTWVDEFHENVERGVFTGYWRCAPGVSAWDFSDNNEVIYVIDGSLTVQREGEDAQTFGPGTSVAFPQGWKGTWEITETLTKFYVIF